MGSYTPCGERQDPKALSRTRTSTEYSVFVQEALQVESMSPECAALTEKHSHYVSLGPSEGTVALQIVRSDACAYADRAP